MDWLSDLPRFNEVARRVGDDGRVLVCKGAKGWYMIANEDDMAQSVVLTTEEVRWLAELWRPIGEDDWRKEQREWLSLCREVPPGTDMDDPAQYEVYCHFKMGHDGPHSWHYPHPFATPTGE